MIEYEGLLQEILSPKNIVVYLLIINLMAFLGMWWDKRSAKKGDWRISEKGLFTVVLLGGGIGGILGMYLFRHKTKKPIFFIGFPTILIAEILLVLYLIIKF